MCDGHKMLQNTVPGVVHKAVSHDAITYYECSHNFTDKVLGLYQNYPEVSKQFSRTFSEPTNV